MRIEHWWFTGRLRLRSILRRSVVERELHEELQFHVEQKIEQGIADGLSEEEAHYAALREMDGLEQRKEEIRDTRRVHWLTDLVDDAKYATRSLRRTPALTTFLVIALALGIGFASSTFSILDALIFRPYPVPDPGDVVSLVSTTRGNSFDAFSYREYVDLRAKAKSYEGVVANTAMQAVGFSAEPGRTARIKGGVMVCGDYFRVLGVEPRLGRGFRDEEDRVPGRDAVMVLGPEFWKREFGGDPAAVGKTIRLNGKEFKIIGVAPQHFSGMSTFGRPDFYVPLAMATVFSTTAEKNFFEDRDDRELNVKARLRHGVPLEQARSEMALLARDFQRQFPKFNRDRGAAVHTQFETRTQEDQNWKFGVIFVVLGLAVLLLACTNVAALLLSRGRARTREIAVRLAIGAGRFRLVRLLLTESLMIAGVGGLAGVAIGYGIVDWFHTKQSIIFMSDLPLFVPFHMDQHALLASLAFSLLSALLCGLAPALQSTKLDLVDGLKAADIEVPGRKRLWGRSALVVAQIAGSLMLLTAAFLMARSFQRAMLDMTGFRKDHLLMTSFDPRLAQYNQAQTEQFYRLVTDRARETPGVRSATLAQNLPLGYGEFGELAFVPDSFTMRQGRENVSSTMDTVDEGYFETMGVQILSGRAFRASDSANTPKVAIVNAQFAKHYWPGHSAVGRRIRLNNSSDTQVEIVGVAQAVRFQNESPTDFIYVPLAQHPVTRMVLVLRSSADPRELVEPIRKIVGRLNPNMPMQQTRSYDDFFVNTAVKGPSIAVDLVSMMGGVGLLLATAGLYGLMAYNVSRRTREIGIRMAIGARPSDVLRLMMGRGVVLVGIGTFVGVAMSLAVERLMDSMVFDVGGVDIVTYLVVTPLLFLITMLAAYVPARRASQIAPTQALRYE